MDDLIDKNNVTMLIVDDMEVNRQALKEIFDGLYVLKEAADGLEALKVLEQEKIDIVLLDVVMPRLDGLGVLKRMQSDARWASIPVVVKTSFDEKQENTVLELGAADFVFAPFDPNVVRNRVRNIVDKYILEQEVYKQKLADITRANDAKTAFLARMSHELRTPITGILGLVDLLAGKESDLLKVRDTLHKVKGQAHYLLDLVNDVLDLSAVENDEIILVKKPFLLKEMIVAMAELYYNEFRRKHVDFQFKLENIERENFVGDALRLKQILGNILANAYKYTDVGGTVKATISQTVVDQSHVRLHITVEDSSEGMTREQARNIWKPFEQGFDTKHDPGKGSGLGLAIVKRLAELMGGSVSYATQAGVGTTFFLDLPFETTDAVGIQHRKLSSIKALVVEKEEHTRIYMLSMLREMGLRFDVARDETEALQFLNIGYKKGRGYDICFLDWGLAADGAQSLIEAIRQQYDRDTVLLAVTSYEAHAIREKALELGADTVLSKPVFQSSIYDLLVSITGGESPRGIDKYDFTGRRLLIAEDNSINSEILVGYLKLVHANADVAVNGREVVKRFADAEPGYYDAVLMDLYMPLMDGFEATRAIRGLNRKDAATIPIIAVTANAFTKDIVAVFEAGMNAHVPKPIDTRNLYRTLAQQMY